MTQDLKRTDPALAAALDGLVSPRLPAGFADRVAQAAGSRPAPLAVALPRRQGRGAWTRGRQVLVGIAAFGLMSAAAAATGVFGPITRDTPVIGKIMASVVPSMVAKAKAKPLPKAPPKPALAKAQPTAPTAAPLVADTPPVDPKEAKAQALADRLIARAKLRQETGAPPAGPRPRRIIRQELRDVPPAERRAVLKRARELKREALGLPPKPQGMADTRRARWREKMQDTAFRARVEERRARVEERRARRRALRDGAMEPEALPDRPVP